MQYNRLTVRHPPELLPCLTLSDVTRFEPKHRIAHPILAELCRFVIQFFGF